MRPIVAMGVPKQVDPETNKKAVAAESVKMP